MGDPNELSLVFRITGPNRSVMMTGDSMGRNVDPVVYKYWDELKSDICQIAHHGLDGASTAFYEKVNASTVLIPISESGYRFVHSLKIGYTPTHYAERKAETVIKAFDGDATLLI